MKVTFHGVRGSIPAPGPETNRYGGNTSCVELRGQGGELVILDAGTGINGLGVALMAGEFGRGQGSAAILITHGHWDHIQGFPFFPPVYVPGNRFSILGPGQGTRALEDILEGQMDPHFSPIQTMKNLGATFELSPMRGVLGERFEHGGMVISAHDNPHGRTRALAFRIDEAGRSLIYAPDAGYSAAAIPDEAIAFYAGADVLIHDCTWLPEDRAGREWRGYSSLEEAVTAALRARVAALVLTHYDQDYSDDVVDGMVERGRRMLDERGGHEITITGAREGLTIAV